jgi:hypothetical protein
MAKELPIVCSLEIGPLEERLAEIAAVGGEALIERRVERDRQLLRFRSEPEVRRRLEAIVAGEKECCAFLELSLREADGELRLEIGAPAEGRSTAEALAGAFEAGAG